MDFFKTTVKIVKITLAIVIFHFNFSTFSYAEESRGVGYVLYHALTRDYEDIGKKNILACPDLFEKMDLYNFLVLKNGSLRASTKTGLYGDCTVNEKVEDIIDRHQCLAEELEAKIQEAIELDHYTKKSLDELEQLGLLNYENPKEYRTYIVIVSTNPDVKFINTRRRMIGRLLRWITPAQNCPFKVEIRQSFKSTPWDKEQKKTRVYNP